MLYNGKSLKWNGIGEREAFVLIWSFGAKVTFVAGVRRILSDGSEWVSYRKGFKPSFSFPLCAFIFMNSMEN